MNESVGILILAGGEATRLPGKLLLPVRDGAAGEVPMIVRVLRNMRGGGQREILISGKSTFPADVDAMLDAPLAIDRWPQRGPLGGMLTAMAQMRSPYVFAVAGDAPNVTETFASDLAARIAPGAEALVPKHPGSERIEPLAALYDRLAFLREGLPLLRAGRGSLRAVIERLHATYAPVVDANVFTNVNTPSDYRGSIGPNK